MTLLEWDRFKTISDENDVAFKVNCGLLAVLNTILFELWKYISGLLEYSLVFLPVAIVTFRK